MQKSKLISFPVSLQPASFQKIGPRTTTIPEGDGFDPGPDTPRTTFRVNLFRSVQLHPSWVSNPLLYQLSYHIRSVSGARTRNPLVALPLSHPPADGEGIEPSTYKNWARQHRAKQHLAFEFNPRLWRYTETLIRSYAFCFSCAFFRHSHEERFLVHLGGQYFFIKELWCGLTWTRTRIPCQGSMALNALPY
jgi:hypothetical protein